MLMHVLLSKQIAELASFVNPACSDSIEDVVVTVEGPAALESIAAASSDSL